MTMCASAMRGFLLDHGELPDAPLVTMVPVSVRTPEQFGTFGNRISTMVVELPTDEADPRTRLDRMSSTMASAKERHRAMPASILQDANHVIPPALLARAARVTARIAVTRGLEAPLNLIISNVPGSPLPLYLAGAKLEAQYPISAVIDGSGLNITLLSYRDQLDFGVVSDPSMLDDAFDIVARLQAALEELVALIPAKPPKPGSNGSGDKKAAKAAVGG